MTAVEEIRAAVAKLTDLRDRSIAGPWGSIVTSGDHSYVIANGAAVASIAANDGDNEAEREPTAELIVTLYATIDELLGLLTATASLHADFVAMDREESWQLAIERAGDLGLARAINGVTP